MNNSRTISSILIALAFVVPTMLSGQQIITTSGGNGSGTGGKVSYTVGQVVNNIYSAAGGSVIEGVQQPYEISVETGVEENDDINITITIFPNPTADYLTVLINDFNTEKMRYKLFSINGKEMLKGDIIGIETRIRINDLPAAVYFLKINDENKDIKIFKIIKN